MNIFSISAVAVIISAVTLILKKDNKELSLCISVIGSVVIFMGLLKYIAPIINQLTELSRIAKLDKNVFSAILKSTGICIVSGISSQSCRDCGETTIATHIETTARILIILLCLPLIENIVNNFLKFTEV